MIESVKAMTEQYNEVRLEGEPIMTIEEMGAFVGYADTFCSWCGKYLSTNPSITGKTSHGICQVCSDNVMLEMALEEFKVTPNQELSECLSKIYSRPKQTGWQNERSFLLCTFTINKLMQIERKRKLTERITPNV